MNGSREKRRMYMTSEAKKRANEKYDKLNTRQIILKLNINTDADILKVLDESGNRQGYIKQLIRDDIAKQES